MIYKESIIPINDSSKATSLFKEEAVLVYENEMDFVRPEYFFQWFPKPEIYFSIRQNKMPIGFPSFQLQSNIFPQSIGKISGGDLRRRPIKLYGQISSNYSSWKNFSGEIFAEEFEFQIPNFSPIMGVGASSPKETTFCAHKIFFDGYEIEIIPRPNAKKDFDKAAEQSGFVVTHVGHIKNATGKINVADAAKIATAIGDLIAIFSSQSRYPMLLTGIESNKVTSIVPFLGKIDPASKQYQIIGFGEGSFFERTFPEYYKLIQDSDWGREIQKVVFWYLQACKWSSAETTVVLTQVALEMVSWIEFVEKENLVSSGGFENLPAHDKIRLLTSKLNISIQFTPFIEPLKGYAKAFGCQDPIEAYVQIRNAIVHPKQKNRERLSSDEYRSAIVSAGHIGLYVLEMYMLKKCGYKGQVNNRITRETEETSW